jgi:hypothetical protein
MSVPVATVITHVLVNGLAVYAAAEPIKPADANTVLDAINGVLDDWAAETQASYAETITLVVSTGVNPETIGPTGTWVLPARPVAIDSVALAVGGIYGRIFTTNDPAWWDAQPAGGVGGAFYSADEPNGSLYFSPALVAGTLVRLLRRTTIGPVLQTDLLVLPQGYQSALEFTVMERVARAFHAAIDADLKADAGKARARIWGNNLRVPTLATRGLGLPGSRGGRWNYLTGTWT